MYTSNATLVPFNTGFLNVSPVHSLYYEETGHPTGLPVVFLHGGPGGGTAATDRVYFDPKVYRIVLFDQRVSRHTFSITHTLPESVKLTSRDHH